MTETALPPDTSGLGLGLRLGMGGPPAGPLLPPGVIVTEAHEPILTESGEFIIVEED